jgi:two-component system, response regulator, stage 0 sporulation protein F
MSCLKTVLYIDDEPVNTYLFELNFKKKFTILTAHSGPEGLEIINNSPDINVVISDMKMPGMNGLEFIKQARGLRSDLVYYLVSGYDVLPEIEAALKSQLINGYYCKPFNNKDIENAIVQPVS